MVIESAHIGRITDEALCFQIVYCEQARLLLDRVYMQSGPSFTKLFRRTVNPLYNDIRYNSKIRYNVSSVCTKKSADRVFFH